MIIILLHFSGLFRNIISRAHLKNHPREMIQPHFLEISSLLSELPGARNYRVNSRSCESFKCKMRFHHRRESRSCRVIAFVTTVFNCPTTRAALNVATLLKPRSIRDTCCRRKNPKYRRYFVACRRKCTGALIIQCNAFGEKSPSVDAQTGSPVNPCVHRVSLKCPHPR